MTFKNWLLEKISNTNQFKLILEKIKSGENVNINGFHGSIKSMLSAFLFENLNNQVIYICKDEKEAQGIKDDLEMFGINNVYYFPSILTTPYHGAVLNEEDESIRLDILISLINKEPCIVVLSIHTLLFNIIPADKLSPFIIKLKQDNIYNIQELTKKLAQSGYSRVNKVTTAGEFAVRGDIVDIYYSSYKSPVRVDFYDNCIESIKTFNIITQKSDANLDFVNIPPVKEFIYGESCISRAKEALSYIHGSNEAKEILIEKIITYKEIDGGQYYLNLFYDKFCIIDYFTNGLIIFNDLKSLVKASEIMHKEFHENYTSPYYKKTIKLEPGKLLFKIEDIINSGICRININHLKDNKDKNAINFDFKSVPVYMGKIQTFKEDVHRFITDEYRVVLFTSTEIQADRLSGILNDFAPYDTKYEFNENGFSIIPLYLSEGFISDDLKILFLNDHEMFGKRKKFNKHFYSNKTQIIDSFIDLKPGDYVVHMNHGIGLFSGIERIKSFEEEKDYIAILYADDDKVFIPVEQLNFIQKYISGEFGKPKLDKIGAKGWSRTKERVRASVEKLAKELVKLYSFRLKQKGFAFLSDTEWQVEFEAKFPYEETRDQLITLEEVKRDMESTKPMDRLICGDVGFGKTEIAIRAAFKAVMSGKQVAILVPTTILAEQHYETFSERLKGYPITVDMLSRFRTEKEITGVIKGLKQGKVDIIIGTHRLLSKDISFKNPGLIMIDEEQRFGVKHKEKLKQVKMTLDSLSLTATPIPRTLHMSLSKIRDISIINTPPKSRQPVETYVMEFNEEVLIEAVLRELKREGQVFFLHNRVKTIYTVKKYLEKLVPSARIVVAHGQLTEDNLEEVIHSFINYEYDILLATTIIESGIDMPRVNTIFIDRADKFGLAQLYQLKGRVGRSDKKAYAYLFYSPDTALTEDAMKRLKVISEYTELGSGFKIAMKDMEIRGAGNLLGPEQHGDILAVGFQLYCRLLNEAVAELAPEDAKELKADAGELYLDLKYNGYIPDEYIQDQKQKIEFYKRIAGITAIEEIEEVKQTLVDRFGKIPDAVLPLFILAEIKILCKSLHIIEVIEKNKSIQLKFSDSSKINIQKIMSVISSGNTSIFLSGESPDSIFIRLNETMSLQEKGNYLKTALEKII